LVGTACVLSGSAWVRYLVLAYLGQNVLGLPRSY